MSSSGPIVIIEDDPDDQVILKEAFSSLGVKNHQKYFTTCMDALQYLMTTWEQPFLILSDVNLPGMDGTELRRKVNENEYLRKKSIPFVFFTTTASKAAVNEAYDLMVQGYFEKPGTMEDIRKTLQLIIEYWMFCKHPNSD
jgi:CheY-like chemotaxis protein